MENVCPDCKHPVHDPGKCSKDNCGEDEVRHVSHPLRQSFEGNSVSGFSNHGFRVRKASTKER